MNLEYPTGIIDCAPLQPGWSEENGTYSTIDLHDSGPKSNRVSIVVLTKGVAVFHHSVQKGRRPTCASRILLQRGKSVRSQYCRTEPHLLIDAFQNVLAQSLNPLRHPTKHVATNQERQPTNSTKRARNQHDCPLERKTTTWRRLQPWTMPHR